MKRAIFFGVFICFLISALNAQIDLKGTVINQADFPVDSLEVTLQGLGHTDMTDVDGKFQIAVTGITTQNQKRLPAPRFRGSHFIVPVTANNQNVSVQVFNLKGAKLSTVTKVLSEGEHSLPFLSNKKVVSSSVLIAIVKRGSDLAKFQIIKTGANGYLLREFAGGVSDNSHAIAKRSNPLSALDSLQFIRSITVEGEAKVFIEFTIPIEKWIDEFEVTLDLIPYEAIEWGKTQEGLGPTEVGKELEQQNIYPYDGERYWGTMAWCSEFYSYILRIGGCPLGDDEGSATRPNWLVLGWPDMIVWFEDNAEYIEKSEITSQNYRPNPGDFVQMSEHTTMVRYLDGDNLFTLGGNEGNKVNLASRGNYKTFSSLNGYGRRSGITGNSYISISSK